MSLHGGMSASAGVPAQRADAERWRAELARAWAQRIGPDLEERLRGLVDRLCETAAAEPFTAEPAVLTGATLAGLDAAGAVDLRSTMELLAANLPAGHERMISTLAAFAGGYGDAVRSAVLTEQQPRNDELAERLRHAQGSIEASNAQFDELFSRSASGVAIVGVDGTLTRTNESFRRILDSSAGELAGRTVFDVVCPDDAAAFRDGWFALAEGVPGLPQPLRQWRRLVRGDGETVLANLSVSLLRDADGEPDRYVVIVEDDTDLVLLQNRLSHQSLHDLLTGLPNRQFFTTHLEKVLRTADPATGVTLYHLDLDAFSLVADGLGRQVGDRLLRTVAGRLEDVVAGESAMVARFGCDEFGIVVQNGPDTPDVVTMVDRINEALAEPVYLDGRGVAASASIGVVHRPPRDIAPEELLRSADMTLRRARRSGCRQWDLFDSGQDAADRRWFGLAAGMPGAWETGEIKPVYLPVVELAEQRVAGIEALLRWDHPELGGLPNEECESLAERTGLTLPLGTWLLRVACERIGADCDLPFSVNLTPNQAMDPDLVHKIVRVVQDTGIDATRLRLVFPLRELVVGRGEAVDNVRVLADLGARIVVRDFDGGLGDLTCLEDLPVFGVRLARRLVDRLAPGASRFGVANVLTDLVRLMHSAGILVVVDGIENAEQATWWRSLGADRALGPLFAPEGPTITPRFGDAS